MLSIAGTPVTFQRRLQKEQEVGSVKDGSDQEHTGLIEQSGEEHGLPLLEDSLEHPNRSSVDHTIARQLRSLFESRSFERAEGPGLVSEDHQPSATTVTKTSHCHGEGAMRVDLDEGVHGIYVAANYAKEVISQGSFDALGKDISDEVALVLSNPKAWLRSQVSQTDRGELVIDFSLSALMLPLSLLAIKAGVEETQEALEHHAELRVKRKGIAENLELLKQAPATQETSQTVASHATIIEAQQLLATDAAIEHNFYDGGIGCNSLVSGGAIFTKVVQETTLKIIALCVPQSGALTMATTAIGVAGTVVLGPVAALAAVGMGSFFVHQARKVEAELAQDRQIIARSIAKKNLDPSLTGRDYQAFIDHEFAVRENFSGRFKRWNAGFLSGACCYALCAMAKATIGIAGLAGAATVLASPAGLALILLLGIIGGITMSVCSWQFMVCHGKSKKYQAWRLQELPFLGRRFDSLQTLRAQKGGQATNLREALYDFVVKRDLLKQTFLQTVARDTNKFRQWEERAAATLTRPDSVNKSSKKKQPHKNFLAQLSWIHTYCSQRWNGVGHQQAIDAAHKARGLQSDNLSIFDLVDWLAAPDHEQNQHQLLTEMLHLQAIYLSKKIAAFEQLNLTYFKNREMSPEVRRTFAEMKEESTRDGHRLQKIWDMVGAQPALPLDRLKQALLEIEGLAGTDRSDKALNWQIARYLIEGLSEELTATEGILFDMHRRAFQLEENFYSPA